MSTRPTVEPSNYMQELTRYLSNIMNSVLLGLPTEIKEFIYFDAFSHASTMILVRSLPHCPLNAENLVNPTNHILPRTSPSTKPSSASRSSLSKPSPRTPNSSPPSSTASTTLSLKRTSTSCSRPSLSWGPTTSTSSSTSHSGTASTGK